MVNGKCKTPDGTYHEQRWSSTDFDVKATYNTSEHLILMSTYELQPDILRHRTHSVVSAIHEHVEKDSRLPDTQVSKDLLGTTENGIELLGTLELLNEASHTGLGKGTTTEDLNGLVGDLAREAGRLHLEEGNLTSKVLRLLLVGLCVS